MSALSPVAMTDSLRNVFMVGIGGFVGSVLRYSLTSAVPAAGGFPAGTLVVNVIGCLAIGLLGGLAASQPWVSAARPFLFAGLLGGFTTYSAFAFETFTAGRTGSVGIALANVALHVGLGLGAVAMGVWLAGRLVTQQ